MAARFTASTDDIIAEARSRLEARLSEPMHKRNFKSAKDIADYVLMTYATDDPGRETIRSFNFDAAGRLVGTHVIDVGRVAESELKPREVLRYALLDNAVGVVIAHNHPTSTLEFSPGDIQGTLDLQRILAELEFRLLDHILVAGGKALALGEMH